MAIIIGSTSAGTIGTLTLSDIKAMIQAQGYGTDTTTVQTIMIRAALRHLYGIRRWKFLRASSLLFSATVANDGDVDISTLGRGIMIHSVRIGLLTDYRNMKPVDDIELARERFIDRELGFPRRWTRMGDRIVVYPRPNGTYPLEIVYQALTTLPSADGDTIIWPETHVDILMCAVLIQLCRRQRDRQGEANAKQDLADAIVRLDRDEEFTDRQDDDEVGHWDGWRRGGVELP